MKILVCAIAHLKKSPRANRVVRLLKHEHQVSFLGLSNNFDDVDFIPITQTRRFTSKLVRLLAKLFRLHSLITTITYSIEISEQELTEFDIIVCHDLQLMPYFRNLDKSKIVLDLREFYPRQFENYVQWNILEKPFAHYLCKNYLSLANKCITVSPGLQKAYLSEYGQSTELVHSVAPLSPLPPNYNSGNSINFIYHGITNRARQIERLIYAMDNVPNNYNLDLMVVGSDEEVNKLQQLASTRTNVSIKSPVPYEKIIPTINKYDAGIIFFPGSTFNLEHCMPNKLFEMIQAKIPIIASPLTDLKSFILENQIGYITDNFDSKSLADVLNRLSLKDINEKKKHIERLANEISQEKENKKLLKIIFD